MPHCSLGWIRQNLSSSDRQECFWCLVSHHLAPSATKTIFICAASVLDIWNGGLWFWFPGFCLCLLFSFCLSFLSNWPMLDQKQTYIRTVYVVVCFIRVRHRGWDLLCNERVLTMVGKSREILRKKPRFSTGPGNGLRIPYVQWNVTYNYILELYWSLLW